jgi:hypothetical protein
MTPRELGDHQPGGHRIDPELLLPGRAKDGNSASPVTDL